MALSTIAMNGVIVAPANNPIELTKPTFERMFDYKCTSMMMSYFPVYSLMIKFCAVEVSSIFLNYFIEL